MSNFRHSHVDASSGRVRFHHLRPFTKRARGKLSAAGCWSELSRRDPPDHDYCAALKNFAAVYSAFQAYLEPGDPLAGHDYAPSAEETEEHHLLGLLGDGDGLLHQVDVSDDDIDRCGYLGWLRH